MLRTAKKILTKTQNSPRFGSYSKYTIHIPLQFRLAKKRNPWFDFWIVRLFSVLMCDNFNQHTFMENPSNLLLLCSLPVFPEHSVYSALQPTFCLKLDLNKLTNLYKYFRSPHFIEEFKS